MFFSKKEKEIMENLFLAISTNIYEKYLLTLQSGDVVEAVVETCYESDNGLESIEFEEYHVCAMRILRILNNESRTLEIGGLLEIHYRNYPKEMRDSQGRII